MGLELNISKDESHVREGPVFEHLNHVFNNSRFWYLHPYREHPDIIKRKLAIVASENVELALHDVCSVAASWARLVPIGLHLTPSVAVDIEDMDIVHPLNAIVPSEVVNF